MYIYQALQRGVPFHVRANTQCVMYFLVKVCKKVIDRWVQITYFTRGVEIWEIVSKSAVLFRADHISQGWDLLPRWTPNINGPARLQRSKEGI